MSRTPRDIDENVFEAQSAGYARFRPHYPSELFSFLAQICAKRDFAWDCATGNGQSAEGLCLHFKRVIASDMSFAQLREARKESTISYVQAVSEYSGLKSQSIDLLTVAAGIHWFPLQEFYQEVQRVLHPDGVIAVWTYFTPLISTEIDTIVTRYYEELLSPFRQDQFQYVESGYRGLPFPFNDIESPEFEAEEQWVFSTLLGYLGTSSAAPAFESQRGYSALESISDDLARAWGQPNRRRSIVWPLGLRVGSSST